MESAKYIPQPTGTSDVKLPEELELLVEQMSKNVHEVWAETQIKQGWKYGEQRNDELKTVLASCHTKIFLKKRKNMTVIHLLAF